MKIYLLYNDQRIAKKKTHVKKRTLNPVFNESFVFDLPNLDQDGGGIKNISLEFLLLDWDRVTKNEVKKAKDNSQTGFKRAIRNGKSRSQMARVNFPCP